MLSANTQQVLVVDSSSEVCDCITKWLPSHKWKVTGVQTLAEAKKRVATQPFDLAILSLSLPDGHGLSLVPDIHRYSANTDVVIIVTDADLEESMEAIRIGVVDFVRRPLTQSDFIAMLRRVAVRRSLREGRVEQKLDRISTMISLIMERLGMVETELSRLHHRFEARSDYTLADPSGERYCTADDHGRFHQT